jgi:hypothetical protein
MQMKKLIALLLLTGCASDPYVDLKVVWQHNAGSDWTLQPEREWIRARDDYRLTMNAGLEWKRRTDCPYVEATVSGPYQQMFIGCSRRFGIRGADKTVDFYIEPALVYQVNALTEDFLRTDIYREYEWQGDNPFVHLRIGMRFGSFRCPVIASGRSLTVGAPFGSEDNSPDLYWVDVECGARLLGRGSVFN